MDEQFDPELKEQILEALAQGKKIQAIKLYREASGQGLKESKDFVEALHKKLIAEDPETYAKHQGNSGCSVHVGLIFIALGLLGFALS